MIRVNVNKQKGVSVTIVDTKVLNTPVVDDTPIEIGVSSTIAIVETPVEAEHYKGSYEVTPKAHDEQVLDTEKKYMEQNVVVHKVPYYQVSNTDGKTVYIASEV